MNQTLPATNPLLELAGLPRFDAIRPEHIAPAMDELLAGANAALDRATGDAVPADYDALSAVLDVATERLGRAWGAVSHLNAVADSPALRTAYTENLSRVVDFHTRMGADDRLFAKYKAVLANPRSAHLRAPRQRALANALRDFKLSGAELEGESKQRYAQLQDRQAELGQKFSEHVLDAHEHEFVLADIPGLIEGAAEGRGLGHRFLRHIERARVLVVLLDLASVDGRSPEEQEAILLDELGRYRPDLLERPRISIGTKADVASFALEGDDPIEISAVTRQGLDKFLGRLGDLIKETRQVVVEHEAFVVHRPTDEGFEVVSEGPGLWRITGRSAERVVAMADLTNLEALEYVHDRFRRMGVERALARAGAREGDFVRIAELELEYVEGM